MLCSAVDYSKYFIIGNIEGYALTGVQVCPVTPNGDSFIVVKVDHDIVVPITFGAIVWMCPEDSLIALILSEEIKVFSILLAIAAEMLLNELTDRGMNYSWTTVCPPPW